MSLPVNRSIVSRSLSSLSESFAAPPGKIYLLYGDTAVFPISLRVAAYVMNQGMPVAVVDGCNRFSVHTITRYAREQRINPDMFLNRVFVSRGFTCYQIEAAIVAKLMPFLRRIGSRTAMIFGLLDTFYDEQVPFRDAQQILRRILCSLQLMKTNGISVLLAGKEYNVLPKERNRLSAELKIGADKVYRIAITEENRLSAVLETDHPLRQAVCTAGKNAKGEKCHGTDGADLHQHY